jgi:FKBP-type peptidyl-prolyl cis-trans isomerase 2
MAQRLVRDEEGLSTLWSLIVALLVVIAILGVYFLYLVPKFAPAGIRAQSGDAVQVDYVGTFENGLVFDTSLGSVASDNASYPKAFSFSWRTPWSPLSFTIGATPLAVIKGFDSGVQGLAVGDAKTIIVPPDLGYGPADPTRVVVKPLFENVPVRLTMAASDFAAVYRAPAVSGTTVTDPFWGWPALVSVSNSVITVTNSPTPGQTVRPYGQWNAQVVSIDDGADGGIGRIVVHHLLDASHADRVGQRAAGGAIVFVVTRVDLSAGTYTLNFNSPVKGRILIFHVTMVHISRLS